MGRWCAWCRRSTAGRRPSCGRRCAPQVSDSACYWVCTRLLVNTKNSMGTYSANVSHVTALQVAAGALQLAAKYERRVRRLAEDADARRQAEAQEIQERCSAHTQASKGSKLHKEHLEHCRATQYRSFAHA